MFDEQTETELHKLRLTLTDRLYSDQRRQIRELERVRDALNNHNMRLEEEHQKLRDGLFDLMNKSTEELFNTKRGSKAEKHMLNVVRDVEELFRLWFSIDSL